MRKKSVPYWRLSGFYFFYFASLGVLLPYWSLYLKSLDFSAVAIGTLIAILPATKIFAPYAWGWIADHTGRPMTIVQVTNIFTVITFLGVFFSSSFIWLAIVMFLFSVFWNSSLPLFEGMTLNHLGEDHHQYSSIRLWGSLGFILTVVFLGEYIENAGINAVPSVVLFLFVCIMLTGFTLREKKQPAHEHHLSIGKIIRQPSVLAFLTVCLLMVLSHGPYYTFYSIYLEEAGYSRRLIGFLWAIGVIAEVIVFLMMYRLLPAFGVRKLLLVTFVFTALRWLLIGYFVDSLAVLFIAQLFHAFSFGVFHAVGIVLMHHYFRGRYQARGQALYSSLSFGAGGALGSFLSGLVWDQIDHSTLFTLAAAVAIIAFYIIWRHLHTDLYSDTAIVKTV